MGIFIKICFILILYKMCLVHGHSVSLDEFEDLKKMVNSLKDATLKQQIKYDDLNRKYKDLEKTLNIVLTEIKETKSRLSICEDAISEDETKNRKDEQEITQDINMRSTNQSNITDTRRTNFDVPKPTRLSSLFRRAGSQVAFFVREVVDYKDLGLHQTIVFKKAITNIGNDYNPLTGVFLCRQPGVYVFFFGTEVFPGQSLHTAIVKNGEEISFNYASGSPDYKKPSAMAIIQLNVGDSIWVRVISHSVSGLVLSDPENYFSGFLLY